MENLEQQLNKNQNKDMNCKHNKEKFKNIYNLRFSKTSLKLNLKNSRINP